jgi:hypothetical protein
MATYDNISIRTKRGNAMAELADEIFAELRKIDTPTITNVVATYPKNPVPTRNYIRQ